MTLRATSGMPQAVAGVSPARAFGSSLLSNGLVVVVGCAVLLWWFSFGRSTEAATGAAPSALAQSLPAGPPVRATAMARISAETMPAGASTRSHESDTAENTASAFSDPLRPLVS